MTNSIKKTIRSIRNRSLHALGSINPKQRMIPDFLIIGAQKGGTSSLFYYLKFHPQVKRPIKKEIHFFNIHYSKGIKWYKAHFPLKSNKHITGEASPDYLFHPQTPKRVHDLNPNIKLIVLLRNPIERAYSAFQMNKRMGLDKHNSFKEAIEFEMHHQKETSGEYDYIRHNFFYLERGKYAMQLDYWLEYFSKEQIHVIKSETFFNDSLASLKSIYEFLSIDNHLPNNLKAMNVGKYPNLSNDIYDSLKMYFESDQKKLAEKWKLEFAM